MSTPNAGGREEDPNGLALEKESGIDHVEVAQEVEEILGLRAFSTTASRLLSGLPYVLAAILALGSGWLGDRYHLRGPIIAVHQLITASGMLIAVYFKSNAARYCGALLGIGFLQFCVPGILTFPANNITTHSRQGVASTVCLIGGGIGGVVVSCAFLASDYEQSCKCRASV
ncbi:uncharacterized protein BO97DRAFT_414332 [Aspergillus homomorphus CBS 101889]|uniref:Major facilitator superfamily (MFS) profile domain-containing protein n=1 Tax=Aspergillus homomorphus (strain CBS 101889) TaxID=1450537 RepID=A0A395I1X4_ASPHC|nr:hypothetical protein BO97DRAFT_414332 [Aspergillus homomorphus CBS 101889]RAL12564.1 hypothetical protein BO97DRAFT_414332 [Aspergillus homomorphus CBS 101889]